MQGPKLIGSNSFVSSPPLCVHAHELDVARQIGFSTFWVNPIAALLIGALLQFLGEEPPFAGHHREQQRVPGGINGGLFLLWTRGIFFCRLRSFAKMHCST